VGVSKLGGIFVHKPGGPHRGEKSTADIRGVALHGPLSADQEAETQELAQAIPFAYLRRVLPALFGFGQGPGAEALAEWLPDVWWRRQQAGAVAGGPMATSPSVGPVITEGLPARKRPVASQPFSLTVGRAGA
jgi:hypothetical protein